MNDDHPASESPSSEPIEPIEPTTGALGPTEDYQYDPIPDTRLYVPDNSDWDVHIKRDSERVYCYAKLPGEDWFHLILNGEIYVTRQHERYCLRCALRMSFLTQDRLFWQHRVPKRPSQVL